MIIHIPKVNGAANAEDFRPINMLYVLGKVLETVVKEHFFFSISVQKRAVDPRAIRILAKTLL